MKYLLKLLIGILYILIKYAMYIAGSILLVIWDFSFENLRELWEEHDVFYIKTMFRTHEVYRYNTLKDFLLDRKNYTHEDNLFKLTKQ